MEIDTNKPNECFCFSFKPKTYDKDNLAYINKFFSNFGWYKEKDRYYRINLRSFLKKNDKGFYRQTPTGYKINMKTDSKIIIQHFENDSCIYKMVFNKKE